jgi:hypothetical protein
VQGLIGRVGAATLLDAASYIVAHRITRTLLLHQGIDGWHGLCGRHAAVLTCNVVTSLTTAPSKHKNSN